MRRSLPLYFLWFFVLLVCSEVPAQSPLGFPAYSLASISNAANNINGYYAPNTFISIYGQNLASFTSSSTNSANGRVSTIVGSGVKALVNGQPASITFQSAGQVNILIPSFIGPGPATLQLSDDTRYGPTIKIQLGEAAPGLFPMDGQYAIATHGNGPVVTSDFPATRGEVVVIYAGGLGPTNPMLAPYQIPTQATPLARAGDFQVLLNNTPVDPSRIEYVGVTPGFPGLFQINLKLPNDAPSDPDIRVGFPESMSPAGRILPLR